MSTGVRRTVLDNGLVVIARPNRASRSVAVRLLVAAGASSDASGKEGTASLISDLLDRGAGPLSAEAIATFFDDLGVSFTASARRDLLEIELRLLSEHLSGVLQRLRVLVSEPMFPEDEVRREKSNALTAIAERDQDTAAVAEMALYASLYPAGHPYRHPVSGTRDSVAAIERGDLVAFHRAGFRPGATILSLAGDFDARRALDFAAAAFGSWAANGGSRTAAPAHAEIPDVAPPAGALIEVRPIAGKTQADIVLGFRGLKRRAPDLPAAFVMNNILGEFSLGGRLGKAIRDRAGLAYYAFSHFSAGLGVGPYMVRAGVAPEGVRRAVTLMRRTIDQIARRGVEPSELRDSRQALAASIPRRLETNPEAASVLADAEFYGLGVDYPWRLPDLIRAVDRDQVDAAARAYLTPGRSVLVVAGPPIDKETLT